MHPSGDLPNKSKEMEKEEITLGDSKTYLSKVTLLRTFQIAQKNAARITR
jgi:hypothetical protein